MRLYHHPASHNARRTVALARHLELPVELVSVDLGKGEQRSPEFLALNPNGKVPVLVDGEFVLWESSAILVYLAASVGSPLAPTAPRDRADVERWLAFTNTQLSRAAEVFLFEHAIKPFFGLGAPDAAALEKATPGVEAAFAILDGALARRPFLAASGLTVADFAVYSILESREAWKLPPLPAGGALADWVARMGELPGWQR